VLQKVVDASEDRRRNMAAAGAAEQEEEQEEGEAHEADETQRPGEHVAVEGSEDQDGGGPD